MPIQPSDFSNIADELFFGRPISADAERSVRTVAGRAYYAAYLAIREAAREATSNATFNIGHRGLASHLEDYEGDLEAVAIQLAELRYFREISDYWPAESVAKASIGLALNNAKGIVRDYKTFVKKLDAAKLGVLDEKVDRPRRPKGSRS